MPTKQRLVVANWKNNCTLADAHVLTLGVRNSVEHLDNVITVLCPPLVWLTEVRGLISPSMKHLAVGVQDVSAEPVGPHTGDVAADLIAPLAKYAIIGHSEYLLAHKPTMEQLHDKIHAALANKMKPIICVGEEAQSTTAKNQLKKRLELLLRFANPTQRAQCIVAYEPIWAISPGSAPRRPASPEYAAEVIATLRTVLPASAQFLYGGSVTPENVASFVSQPGIDGVLVGGASLRVRSFTTLVKNVSLA